MSTIPTGDGADHGTINGALNRAFPKAITYLWGNSSTILGSPDDDANGIDFTMNKMDELVPQALILGGISPADMAYLRLGDYAYLHGVASHLLPVKQESIVARKRLSHYF